MSYNLFKAFRGLFQTSRLQVGVVASTDQGTARIILPDGSTTQAIGDAITGTRVYVEGGKIVSQAPSLPVVAIEV